MGRVAVVLACLAVSASIAASARAGGHITIQADAGKQALPVVLWHGMGDSCCASYSIGFIKKFLEDKLGVFVHSIDTGSGGALNDVWSSYFGNVNDQVAKVCAQLRDIPELSGGYNAVGFSQGGQFMRAVVQRCQHLGPKAHTLVTLGAQHQGVINIPGCSAVPTNLTALLKTLPQQASDADLLHNSRSACDTMQTLLARGAYLPWIRDHLVQAQYFKDPVHLDSYMKLNPFLPDINNEREEKNHQYAVNLASLKKLALFRFAEDTTVEPRDSSWFSDVSADKELIPVRETDLYKEDWIGLKQLDDAGRLVLLEAPGQHMNFDIEWFEANVMWPFLAEGQEPEVDQQ